MAVEQHTLTERLLADKERYVSNGISTPMLAVARAEGAWLEDVDGRRFLDFAGGIACQNVGHGLPAVVAAIHEQADRYLHQCFMIGLYEPYVEVCRRLAELSPCRGEQQKSLLVNSGAEAVENAVKIARYATGRDGVIAFEHAFHGRTLLTMTMTSKVMPYKKGFGPFAPEVYRAKGPYPYRGVSSDDAIKGLEKLLKSDVAPDNVACVVIETVQGEGGFLPLPDDFPARLRELCDMHGILYVADEVQSGTGRTGPVWAIEHYGVEPDLVVSGKSLGGGLPLAGVTGRSEVMDTVHPGGLGGTFGGNPISCAAAIPVLEMVASPEYRRQADELGVRMRSRLDAIATRWTLVRDAHAAGRPQDAAVARQALVLRYARSVRRYVGAMVKNADDADELAQEVVVRLLKGDFAGADPDRGRFRDLLKTAVRNMVHNHWAKANRRRPAAVDLDAVATDDRPDADWLGAWQQNVLDHAWSALKDHERTHPGHPAHALLRLRAEFPDDTSDQLAARLSAKTGTPVRADACRQMLRRARLRFATLLVDEVELGLADPTPDRVQEELAALGLLDHVREFMPDDWTARGRLAAE